MKMVDGHDVDCQDGDFLSWFSVCRVLFGFFGNFSLLWILVDGYGRYMIFFSFTISFCNVLVRLH